jgi:hypothetical protein
MDEKKRKKRWLWAAGTVPVGVGGALTAAKMTTGSPGPAALVFAVPWVVAAVLGVGVLLLAWSIVRRIDRFATSVKDRGFTTTRTETTKITPGGATTTVTFRMDPGASPESEAPKPVEPARRPEIETR